MPEPSIISVSSVTLSMAAGVPEIASVRFVIRLLFHQNVGFKQARPIDFMSDVVIERCDSFSVLGRRGM